MPTPTWSRSTAEEWLAAHPWRVRSCLLLAAAFVRLILCLQIASSPLARIHEVIPDSDSHFFDQWGRRIAAGEWLQPRPFHPMTGWMDQVADTALRLDPALPGRLGLRADPERDRPGAREELWSRWMGGPTFYQEPAYPYLIGLTYRLTGPQAWHVFGWQLVLGLVGVCLLHQLTRCLFSETAALAAGALAVAAPVPLLYEVVLLRDGLIAFVSVVLALAMWWAPRGGLARWFVLGLGFGAAALLKESLLLFPLVMAVWRWAAVRPPLRKAVLAAGLVAAGMAVALLPAMLRNLAVGVPPLALNGSAAGMLAIYHCSSALPMGIGIGPEYARVLLATEGRLLPSLLAAVRTHHDVWGFLALTLQKLFYSWHGFEAPNGVDPYLFRQQAPLLRVLPASFLVLAPLAGVGIASRRVAAAWPLLVAILASLPALVLASVLSRYRAPLTTLLLPLAGMGVVRLISWVRGRRWRRLAVVAGAMTPYLVWANGAPPGDSASERARDYALSGVHILSAREPEYAALSFREAVRLDPGNARFRAGLGQALLATGDVEAALREVETAARTLESSPMRELHARALAAAGRTPEAIEEARAALALDPSNRRAAELLELLERGPRRPPLAPRSEGSGHE
jgi:hypothetical protein